MLIEVAEEQRKLFVPIKLVKDLLSITTQELAENMIIKTMNPKHHNHDEITNHETALYQTNHYDHNYDLSGIESRATLRKHSQSATCSLS